MAIMSLKSDSITSIETALQAAKAYNKAAKKYHGEFARLNSISQ